MTEREKQVFELLRANPSLSQDELAGMLGIARSSAAAHISSLQRKGFILGRGYLFGGGEYVLGVGAANVDIHTTLKAPLVPRDSNPSYMRISAGGVTRNICENLAKLGTDARLITAVGDDPLGERILGDTALSGVDVSNVYTVPGGVSSTYISVLDNTGEMIAAFSDMRILESLPPEHLRRKSPLINGARLTVCDPSLPLPLIEQLAAQSMSPVYLDPVSTSYAQKVKGVIGLFDTVKPNRLEAEILADMSINGDDDLREACKRIIARGVRRVFVSLGGDGCYYLDESGCCLRRSLRPFSGMANATGGGDAFMAGVIFMTLKGAKPEQIADFALAAGLAAVMSPDTINPDMSEQLVNKLLTEYKL